jgi:hypothetical protein
MLSKTLATPNSYRVISSRDLLKYKKVMTRSLSLVADLKKRAAGDQ